MRQGHLRAAYPTLAACIWRCPVYQTRPASAPGCSVPSCRAWYASSVAAMMDLIRGQSAWLGRASCAARPMGAARRSVMQEAVMGWLQRFRRTRRGQQMAGGRKKERDYIFGESEHEISRLDMQHYMFRWEFGGDYLAPVRPTAILDVACGTGRWALDMARRFPRAAVVAFDINRDLIERVLSDPELPGNCTFVVADALKPFEFTDGHFDFVMARANSAYIPIPQWPSVVAEMARVTGSGGWVELRDFGLVRSESPALTSLTDLFARMAAMRPIYPGAGTQLAGFLRAAGLREVKARPVSVRLPAYLFFMPPPSPTRDRPAN